jgi:hypothetical protein
MLLMAAKDPQSNDRVYSVSLTDIPREKLAVKRSSNVSRVIVKKGKLLLLFIEKGLKINQDYYIEHVLENHLFEPAKNFHGEDFICWLEDNLLVFFYQVTGLYRHRISTH